MDPTNLTISEAAALIARRSLSPVDLTRAHLARVEQLDPLVNSFITVTADHALRRAHEAEAAIRRGDPLGTLHGIPIAYKDLIQTKGTLTTAGSSFLANYIPEHDAAVVHKLHAAGAISLGKLNLHEWAMSVTNNNPFFGACNNPWNLRHIPGGSSGGSGAALAARLCLGALGSDTGGSIRIPAALCGVAGLKPTYGRVSTRGIFPLSPSLDHVGPMARRVRDVALLLQAIAGHDPADPTSANMPADDYLSRLDEGVRGWRVGLLLGGFFREGKHADPEVLQAVRQAALLFEQLGAHVDETELPQAQQAVQATLRIIVAEAAAFHHERLRDHPEGFGEDVLASLRRGQSLTAAEYAEARQLQPVLRRRYEELFTRYDLLLTPTTPVPAPLRDEPEEEQAARPSLVSYTAPWNLVGFPALSVPCGFTSAGLPIGLQLIGPPWSEAKVLQAGHAYEQATDLHLRQSPL